MEDSKKFIYDFLNRFEDFTESDRQNGYAKVYRPALHPYPVQFWFNPPFDENGKSKPTPSATIILKNDGEIMVENLRTGLFFNLDECLGHSIDNFVIAIEDYYREGAL